MTDIDFFIDVISSVGELRIAVDSGVYWFSTLDDKSGPRLYLNQEVICHSTALAVEALDL